MILYKDKHTKTNLLIKKKEILFLAARWVNNENIVLNGVSQTEEDLHDLIDKRGTGSKIN